MLTLRLTQHTDSPDHYHVELALEGDGLPRQTANPRFEFQLSEQDYDDIRWYLEDFLQYPLDPAPTIASRVEKCMAEIGTQLFKSVFQSDDDARDLWATLRTRLNDTRVEVITEVKEAASIPWELLRDPKTDVPLALRAQAFVRAQPNAAQQPALPHTAEGEPIRILLVICRPGGRADVPFRSVASRIIKGLTDEAREHFQLDVLRPPTFEQLSKVLHEAKENKKPYHIVHFDGHGLYAEPQSGGVSFSRLLFSDDRLGKHGYLAFENPALPDNIERISGPRLGALLVETQTPVLVLNACRSAHADSPSPDSSGEVREGVTDPHSQVRAFGSLAQEVMDAGVAGVVAMRYNVYVVTAAQFVADLYAGLAQGQSLGEAVTLGRKQLAAQPLRAIAYDPIPLQDWPVPIVYEAAPIKLFSRPRQTTPLNVNLQLPTSNLKSPEDGLPPRPDVGFYGRDETLLALDRAFDTEHIVLLWAYAGSGKTTTAVEFVRWYAQTGGLEWPVLFTSFENYKPPPQVLDTMGRVFEQVLDANKIQWLALTNDQRRQVALLIMQQTPVLWIWDNVEPIAGFPTGTPSTWSAAEQQELADFLRAARETQAKFLLTSRRDERSWLGELPTRLTLPPMPMQERMQLARALADKYRVPFTQVKDWQPLLDFTQGNPLTITVVVGQALREGITNKEQIAAYLEKLRAGEQVFEDEQAQGRSKSLGASLSYGFASAFTEDERKILALLHFFQGAIDVDVLCWMGNSKEEWCLPEIRDLSPDEWIALLDRAAEIGLLTVYGSGYYSAHPALTWFLESLFEQFYFANPPVHAPELALNGRKSKSASQDAATRAYVDAMATLGAYLQRHYENGDQGMIADLAFEESNFLHARQLARIRGWPRAVVGTMQGLRALYRHAGHHSDWKTLVDEITPDFIDPETNDPRPGYEEFWSLITEYRVDLAETAHQWAEAEHLQRRCVQWDRQQAQPLLYLSSDALSEIDKNMIRTLAVSLETLGHIMIEQDKPECIDVYREAISFCQRIGDKHEESSLAFNIGLAYVRLSDLHDLCKAERWNRRGLELLNDNDRLGRGKGLISLGIVASLRFKGAKTENKSRSQIHRHVKTALEAYYEALTLLPPDALDDLATAHANIGEMYKELKDHERALDHFRQAMHYAEETGNLYIAAKARFNLAVSFANTGRFNDALLYMQTALQNFETFGPGAEREIQYTRKWILAIQKSMKESSTYRSARWNSLLHDT